MNVSRKLSVKRIKHETLGKILELKSSMFKDGGTCFSAYADARDKTDEITDVVIRLSAKGARKLSVALLKLADEIERCEARK